MAKFNLMSYLLPPEEKVFYKLFEDSTQVCRDSSLLFNEIVKSKMTEEHMLRSRALKHKSSELLRSTIQHLNKTFVTPIEPEDIQYTAILLYKITKRIIHVCNHIYVYKLDKCTDYMIKQSETLLKATEELQNVIHLFKKNSSVAKITESNLRMKEIETYGDEIFYKAITELFSGKYEALEVIKMKSIHKYIEKALDSCFSVSDEIVNVVLKQN